MVGYTAQWNTPQFQPGWGNRVPSADILANITLLGDVQTNWEEINEYDDISPFVSMGKDIDDRMIRRPPDAGIQMGDVSDIVTQDPQVIYGRFDSYKQWLATYGLDLWIPWYQVMGNHDIVGVPGGDIPPVITADDWRAYWGYETLSYSVDLGNARVLVFNGSGTGAEMDTMPGSIPVRPYTQADVAWLDGELSADSRPTLLAAHAPLHMMHGQAASTWSSKSSTVLYGSAATDLLQVMDSHPHFLGWMHGHTHSSLRGGPPNSSLFNTGSREIVGIDASCLFLRRSGDRRDSITFYVSILNDGKSVELQWRDHDKSLWVSDHDLDKRRRVLTAT